uniref:Uncharacterized protein n=1 Tax=Ananas comosus var. bracteatus TaxID=296719 RepID=A0A6V7PJ56_ANACO|nr:unnamed protein product [Ananas comosus var. bracteatus]
MHQVQGITRDRSTCEAARAVRTSEVTSPGLPRSAQPPHSDRSGPNQASINSDRTGLGSLSFILIPTVAFRRRPEEAPLPPNTPPFPLSKTLDDPIAHEIRNPR